MGDDDAVTDEPEDLEDYEKPPACVEGECYGCKKPLPRRIKDGKEDPHRQVKLVLGGAFAVYLCAAYNDTWSSSSGEAWRAAKRDCLRRAIERARVCGACGRRMRNAAMVGACDECRARIAAARHAEASPREWYAVARSRVLPNGLQRYYHREDDIVDALLTLAAGDGLLARDHHEHIPIERTVPRRDDHHRDLDRYLRLTAAQAAALEAIGSAIAAYGMRLFAEGREKGRKLLIDLAEGKTTTRRYDECVAEQEKEEAVVVGLPEEDDASA